MVICLLLAGAASVWPLRSRVGAPEGVTSGRLAVIGRDAGPGPWDPAGGWFHAGTARALMLAALASVLGMTFVVAGVPGLTAAGAAVVTGTVLVRRALADRRRRTALIDITRGVRMLGRELRAGAEPSVAAANAGAAARGAGAEVLAGLARLTRADDRSSVGSSSAAQLPDDPHAEAMARLHSGWLLTRRHGLAFTPLIDALAADLSEQIAAEAERAGQVAGPRMSGYVMAVLPLFGLALGVGMGADPVRVLLVTPAGNILLLVGVLLTCAGLLWSARIVRR